MATREKGRKKTKQKAPQEASQQFKVTDPISMADLENIHTRRGKYPWAYNWGTFPEKAHGLKLCFLAQMR